MFSCVISLNWFNDIKDEVMYKNPYFFTENGRNKVEADFCEGQFNRISQLKGWM